MASVQLKTQKLLLAALKGIGPENKNQVQEIQAFKKVVQAQREKLPSRSRWERVGSF